MPKTGTGKPRRPENSKLTELIERVGYAVRTMGAQSVITSRTMADRFGLHTTDLEVLDLIFMHEQVAAGELAAATGLTSGAVTALIDRLVSAGYVERRADPNDRRKVLVRVRPDAIKPIEAAYSTLQQRMFALWSTFAPRDLAVIVDFIERSTALAVATARDIQQHGQTAPARRKPRTATRAPSRRASSTRASARVRDT